MNKAALVVMAAGMASRYGGNKQIDGMGPNGEILMEYSIRDAIRAGFTKVVFIIRPDLLNVMKNLCGDRFSGEVEVRYAFQDFSSIPDCYSVPAERVKPFGTVHAVLCAREHIREPFAVINADDYYGVESFRQMYEFLTTEAGAGSAAMMGYRLDSTVSPSGTVSRGICEVENGMLAGVRELKKIRVEDGAIVSCPDGGEKEILDAEAPVSMNFWGFSERIFDEMDGAFRDFLAGIEEGNLTAECLLPVLVDGLVRSGRLRVRVLPTKAQWFGVTYKEDRPAVEAALRALHERGVY